MRIFPDTVPVECDGALRYTASISLRPADTGTELQAPPLLKQVLATWRPFSYGRDPLHSVSWKITPLRSSIHAWFEEPGWHSTATGGVRAGFRPGLW